MREPWKKHGGWPYEGRRGKTWQLGYRDHEGRVRSKSFKTKSAAERWSREYVDAERRNRLREFLLGCDAPEVQPDSTPISELILDWLASDAHPDSTGGLARNSWDTYRSIASRHIIGNPIEQRMKKTGEIVQVESATKPARPERRLRDRPPACRRLRVCRHPQALGTRHARDGR
jgi:hypothetical protein